AAFTFESLQKTKLSAAELKKITGMEATALAKNPFLEENTDGTWAFENKNIQEYFVATLMVELCSKRFLSWSASTPISIKYTPPGTTLFLLP
ncbi:MAG: hypothetical protein PQJ28_01695, partial [Spirochaetales bacterium]|nr:hypothetical protein [Spirochaetales bacterium]